MKFTHSNVELTGEILKRKLGGELFAPITLASTMFSDKSVVKAGTPINASGVTATTTSASGSDPASNDAIGILLNDVYDTNPNGSLIKAFATINATYAQSHASVSYDAPLKAALSNIVFE